MSEQTGGLPRGWISVKISDLLKIEYGKALQDIKRVQNGKFPVYGSSGIVGHHSDFLVPNGGLIVGRKGTAGQVHISKGPFWAIDTTYYITPPKEIDIDFLYNLLSFLNLGYLDKSTAIPSLRRDDMYSATFQLPPFPEQRRIVAKVEELFSKIDEGMKSLETAKVEVKHYRHAVLKASFEGKLTAEWRKKNKNKLEPAEKLLERIAAERKDKKKETEPLDLEDLPKLPEGWIWARLYNLLKIEYGKALPQGKRIQNGKFPVYGSSGVVDHHSEFLVSQQGLIVGRKGAAGQVYLSVSPFWAIDTTYYIVPPKEIDIKFLFNRLGFLKLGSLDKSTAIPSLRRDDMYSAIVPLPPLDEQIQIVQEIEQRLTVADKAEILIDKSLKEAQRLRQSILKRAFEGKLVPQDPNDEPAEKLLERIRAERGRLNHGK